MHLYVKFEVPMTNQVVANNQNMNLENTVDFASASICWYVAFSSLCSNLAPFGFVSVWFSPIMSC